MYKWELETLANELLTIPKRDRSRDTNAGVRTETVLWKPLDTTNNDEERGDAHSSPSK